MDATINGKPEAASPNKEQVKKKESGFVKFLYSGGILVFLVLGFVLAIVILIMFNKTA